jgi:hypothetical protein
MHQPAALGRITALGVSLSRSEIERPGDRLTGSASRWRPVTDYGKSSMRPLRVFTQPGPIAARRPNTPSMAAFKVQRPFVDSHRLTGSAVQPFNL